MDDKIKRDLDKIKEQDAKFGFEFLDEEDESKVKAKKSNKNNELDNKAIKKAKKKKRLTVQLSIALVLILVGTLVSLFVLQSEKKREYKLAKEEAVGKAINLSRKTIEDYVACITKADYSKMYMLVNNGTKEKRTEENFIFVNKAFYNNVALKDASVNIKKCYIPNKEELQQNKLYIEDKYDASNTRIECTMTVTTDGGEFSFDKSIDLVKEDGQWHIMWNSGIIYPNYMPLDVVKNTYASALRGEILDRNNKKLATMVNGKRNYPYGIYASHLVGFVSRITDSELKEKQEEGIVGYSNSSIVGKKGLEYAFESKVKGVGGQTITLCDQNGTEKEKILESEAKLGESLKTTIDINIQKALYNQIKNENACSVAINPYTGEILALVSTPAYNNNDVIAGKASDTFNRFSRSFCPGSTFKPITGAVGLDCGAFTKDTDFGPSPRRWQKNSSWGSLYITTQHQCKKGTLINGITLSDNVYFAKAALRIGGAKLKAGLDKIGFNEQIPFEMNFTASQYSNSDSFTSEAMIANSGYGQGQILVNPLHLASIYSAFVNKGNMVMPVFEYSGKTKYWKENAFKENTANTIKECLENVVKSGTGTGARSYKMTIAGKTGTAEIKASQKDENGIELGWFVALTTDTKPSDSILIVTMVEDVERKGGSAYVVSKTKRMLKEIYGNDF